MDKHDAEGCSVSGNLSDLKPTVDTENPNKCLFYLV